MIGEPDDDLPGGLIYATAGEADKARLDALTSLGFRAHRRELVLELPTDTTQHPKPAGVGFVQADTVDEERLRLLDDDLRQDVPGTDGWEWGADQFHSELYSPGFDPATYLVAVDGDGSYLGIARVWMRPEQPRLGFIGVRSERRRQGIARALLAEVLREVHRRGVSHVRTEVDETNVASRSLLCGFGGTRVGAVLELRRP